LGRQRLADGNRNCLSSNRVDVDAGSAADNRQAA